MSYYKQNREIIIQKQKQYRQNNLEYIKDVQRMWYQKKRYHIRCSICGVKYLKHNEKNHFKTQRHKRGYTKIQPKEQEPLEQEKIIPHKVIFVSKNKILWRLP